MKRALVVAAVVTASLGTVGVMPAHAGTRWDNCTSYNKHYPHGVGRVHAHDHTTGKPVRDFRHSNRLYRIAMRHNRDLDRDKDHIACEKA